MFTWVRFPSENYIDMVPCDRGVLGISSGGQAQRCYPQTQVVALVASTEGSAAMGAHSNAGSGLCSDPVRFPSIGERPQNPVDLAPSDQSISGTSSGIQEQLGLRCRPWDEVVASTDGVLGRDAERCPSAAIDPDSDVGEGLSFPVQIPASTVGDTAPGLAHWPTTDGVRLEGLDGILETVSLPQIRALVRSARLQTTVRGQRVFRRNGGAVCRLGREVCGPEGLLWSKAAWDGARKAALSGLEGLVGVPESALLEGFRQVVVSTAGAHLEGLKQQGREGGVRGRLQACGAKILRPNHGGRRTGGDCNKQLGARSDPHTLCCNECGAPAEFGLRGSKEGGSVKYSCRAHTTSSGCFRIDQNRAAWAEDREMRRLRAQERRLEEELRNLGGPSFTAKPPYASEKSQSAGSQASMPMSRLLIAALLMMGGIEINPGPTADKEIEMEVCIWRTSDFNAIPKGETEGIPTDIKLLPDTAAEEDQRLHLLNQFWEKERVFVWGRPLRPGGEPVFREVERAKALKAPPLMERLTQRPQIKVVSAAGKRGQDAGAGRSTDAEMRDADQGNQNRDLGPSPIKNWSEREEAVGDKIVEARGALAHCMVSEPDSFRSPVTNEHTQHIGGLNIVAAPLDTPLLLLTNLPLGKQGRVATDDEVLKWFHEADNEPITPPPTAVLLGPPGIGKTRKCMHLGSIEPGVIYLTCERSGELRAPDMEAVRAKLEQCEAEPQSWKANFARAKRHLLACLYARVSLLKYFLENQARQAWDLRHWMLFQSGVAFGASMAPMLELYRSASLVHVEQLEEQLADLLGKCAGLLGDNRRVCIALDEAQSWASALNHCFPNGDPTSPQGRPLLSAAMRILAEPPLSQHLKILLAGTGFSLLSTNIVDSALAKHGTFKARQLSLFKTLSEDEVRQYAADFAGKEEADGAVEQIRKLVGRARFVVGAVQRWVGEGGERSLRAVLEEEYDLHTDPDAWSRSTLLRARYEKLYLYGTLCAQARHPQSANLFQQLKRLTFAHWVIGQPACFRNKEEVDLVNLGCALLEGKRDTQMAAIREPVVQTAVQNFLKHQMQWDPQRHAEEMFCESGFQPQVLGIWWELVVAQFIRHMFETKEALADKPLFSNLGRDTLPPAFREMGAILVAVWRDRTSGQFCWKEIEKEERFLKMKVGTTAYGLVDFLKDPKGFVLFFPEDKAGPDLVFFMVVGGELFLVFVQLKLAVEVKEPLKVLRTVDPSTAYSNHPSERKFREEIKEALGPDSGLAGVIACIIGYPLKLPKSIFEEVRDCRPPRRASKRLKLELVADYDISPAVRVVVDGSQKSEELARTNLKPLINALKKAGAVETSTSPTEGTSSFTPMDVS